MVNCLLLGCPFLHVSCRCVTVCPFIFVFFFFNDPPTTEIYTLSLYDALPISAEQQYRGIFENAVEGIFRTTRDGRFLLVNRSEEHTSELQSLRHLVCRLLLEKKKKFAYLDFSSYLKN